MPKIAYIATKKRRKPVNTNGTRSETPIDKDIQRFEKGGSVLDPLLSVLTGQSKVVSSAIQYSVGGEPDETITRLRNPLAENLRPSVSLLKAFINNETLSGHTKLADKADDVKTRLYTMLLELESANGDAKALLKAVGPSGLTPFIREVESLITEAMRLRVRRSVGPH